MNKKKIIIIGTGIIIVILALIIFAITGKTDVLSQSNTNSNTSTNTEKIDYDAARTYNGNVAINNNSSTVANTTVSSTEIAENGKITNEEELKTFTCSFINTNEYENMNLNDYLLFDESYMLPEERNGRNFVYGIMHDSSDNAIWRTQSVKSNAEAGTPELIRTYGANNYYKIPVTYSQVNKVDSSVSKLNCEFYVWVAPNGKAFSVYEKILSKE